MATRRGKPLPVIRSEADERLGQLSPDGRWVAYESNETGRFEVYVSGFPSANRKTRISMSGGFQPRWRSNGAELFYLTFDGRLMSVSLGSNSGMLEPAQPTPLFATHVVTGVGVSGAQYDVSKDGQRFLVGNAVGDASSDPAVITVVLNWKLRVDIAGLKDWRLQVSLPNWNPAILLLFCDSVWPVTSIRSRSPASSGSAT